MSSIAYNKPNEGIAIKTKIKLGIIVQITSIVVLWVNLSHDNLFNVDNSDLDKVLPLSGNDNQKAFKILYIIHETKTITINKKKKT